MIFLNQLFFEEYLVWFINMGSTDLLVLDVSIREFIGPICFEKAYRYLQKGLRSMI